MVTTSHLSTAAIVCAALCLGSVFLNWAVPAKSAADLYAETVAQHAAGTAPDPRREAEIRQAYPLQGTDEPFRGVLLIVIAAAGALLAVAGASLAKDAERASRAEGLLRGAGAVLGVACLLTLLDSSSEIFLVRNRGAGLYAAILFSLAGSLAATFASARVGEVAEAPSSGSDA